MTILYRVLSKLLCKAELITHVTNRNCEGPLLRSLCFVLYSSHNRHGLGRFSMNTVRSTCTARSAHISSQVISRNAGLGRCSSTRGWRITAYGRLSC